MQPNILTYFPRRHTNNALLAFFVVVLLCFLLFGGKGLPLIWVAFAIIEFMGFFLLFKANSNNWKDFSSKKLIHKLFIWSFMIRLIWVVFSYFFFQYQTGQPFAHNAADSVFYHQIASAFANQRMGNMSVLFFDVGLSDLGFPMYLSLIYYLFSDYVIIPRLINALLGAWTVVLIYQLARRNFGKPTARMAGIMAMLMPNLIYYCGVHLKETLMVFLVVAFIERADILLRKKARMFDFLLLVGLGASLFFLRTVLMASALFALFSMVIFIKRAGSNILQRMVLGFWILFVILMTFSYRIQTEFEFLLENADTQAQNMEYKSKRELGNTLATYGSSIIFAPVMFVAPFPTYVNIEHQKTQMMLSGGYFVKNVIAFFVLISIISFIRKRQLRKYILILSFLLAYLAILAQSSFALSERFHLPALPFLIILAAYGITQINIKNQKFYIPYLVIIVLIVIAWNAFKLAGRGGL